MFRRLRLPVMFRERFLWGRTLLLKYFPEDTEPWVCDFENTLGDAVPHLGIFLARSHRLSFLENGASLRATERDQVEGSFVAKPEKGVF